jgi:peptide/nickel transport system substrate-binding protein
MKFGPFFNRFKQQNSRISGTSSLDRKLIGNVNARSLPNLTQLKYLGHFLNAQEKKIIGALGGVIVVAALALGGIFLGTHFEAVAKDGGDYSEAMVGQPKYLNPIYASTSDIDSDLSFLMYNGLFRYANGQDLVPDLAASSSLSADKKVYTISLKPNLKWSDGEPVTADDVVYTFETIQNPESSSPLLPAFQGVTVAKIDENTITFTLKEPFAPFLNSLTIGIIPEHIWSTIQPLNLKLAPTNLKPIGTGPWKFSKLVKDDSGTIQSYVLVPNENYYGQKPHLKTLTFKFFADSNEAIDAVQNQSVSAVSFVPSKSQEKLNSKNLASYHLILPQYTALFFNQERSSILKEHMMRTVPTAKEML